MTIEGSLKMSRAIRALAFVAALAVLVVAAPAAQAADEQLKVKGGKTVLSLSPGAAGAIESLGVAAAPIAPARSRGARFSFPISGGKLDANTLAGQIRHRGGIRLSAGAARLELRRFFININAKPDLTAKVGDSRVSILSLDLSKAKVSKANRRIVVRKVVARLTADAANALNATFNVTAFSQGLELGRASVYATVAKVH
jgi:hypothetical protein